MRKTTLLKTFLLLCALMVGGSVWAQSDYSTTYTTGEDLTLPTTGAKVKINNVEYTAYKLGSGSTAGSLNITVPSGTKYLHLHVAGWNGESVTLTMKNGSTTITTINLTSDSGISGSGSTYTIDADKCSTDYYKVVTFSNALSQDTQFTFTATSGKRFVVWGVNAEEASPFTITVESNNDSYGTVSLSGSTITASPATGYRVSTTTPYTVSPEGSATVSQSGNTFTVTPSANTTVTINFEAILTHTVTFSVNGTTTTATVAEGTAIEFPSNPVDVNGMTFVGWYTNTYDDASVAPDFVTSATMGNSDVTYYAVFAARTVTTEEVTKTYGFEVESDADWTINGPVRSNEKANTGTYSGKINTNNTYVTFKNKVKVTEFSFAFTRTSTNNNYNVYIETSTDNSNWTAAGTYQMNSFNSDGTFSTRTKTFDGTTDLYVRFHCYNTTAVRYVDDVTIKYNVVAEIFSDYCTNIPVPVTITSAKYATYCNATKALDFSETGITVYTAVDNENSVTLNEITSGQVPANTPVVLYKDDADGTAIDVPVIASAEAIEGTNDLRVSTGTDVDYMYVLAMNPTIGFYPWAGETPLSAGRVYLQGKASYGTRTFIGFGEGTSISNVNVNAKDNNNWYDLQGRRVAQPTKGLYIVNGKKVLVK